MKKIVVLKESELISVIKKIVKESITIEPYTLSVVDGNVKIRNSKNKQSYIYGVESEVLSVRTSLNVDSLENGKITLSKGFMSSTEDINMENLKNIIANNWGKSEIHYVTDKNKNVWFVKKN